MRRPVRSSGLRRHDHPIANLSIAVLLGTATVAAAGPVGAGTGNTADHSANAVTFAVIGDVPYGTEQEAEFGDLIDAVNADPKVRLAIHVGDIKSGSTECTDARFQAIREAFDTFEDPLVYTPGDNEWTDCHRANNGTYNPLERLAKIRQLFFAQPGTALGRHPKTFDYEPSLVENVRWIESRVAFATLHVIGSNNGLSAWTGLGLTDPTPAQAAEVQARIEATLQWIDSTFDAAENAGLRGVVLAMQADTWSPTPGSAQQVIVDRIAERTASFDGQVLLIQGDSHVHTVDDPLDLPNFTRVVVHGETLPFEYLRLTIDPRDPDLFTLERAPLG
jgi:hypothetical protein